MDPIADMFSQISNAQIAGKKNLTVKFSNIKMALLGVLKQSGFIADFQEITGKKAEVAEEEAPKKRQKESKMKLIEVTLKRDGQLRFQRISRPGRRVYANAKRIPRAKTPQGIILVSTSQGVMAGTEARKKSFGGEVIAEVII